MNTVTVAHGVSLPFRPMRPSTGRRLSTVNAVAAFNETTLTGFDFVVQPCLSGDRCIVAVVDGKLHAQFPDLNESKQVLNAASIKKLPDKTALDGVLHDGVFFPFDVLAVAGKTMIHRTASERCALAFSFNGLLNNPNFYGTPKPSWMLKRKLNAPRFIGVVIKESSSRYVSPADSETRALTWVLRAW